MDGTLKKRRENFALCSKAPFKNINKKKLIGSGSQGDVFKYCIDSTKICLIGKRSYINKKEYKYIDYSLDPLALKYNVYIEYAAMQLTNQLVLQGVCPHFVLNYRRVIKERVGVCDDEFPAKSTLYNEFIEGGVTFDNWARENHSLNEWYNAYFQITVAIYALQHYYDLTHLDLHSRNVLIRKVQAGGYWKYKIRDTEYFVPNFGYIFYINDFDQAWIPNKFKSWFIRQKKKSKTIHKAYDIMVLFRNTLHYSTSPKTFKNDIRKLINRIKDKVGYDAAINEIWGEKYTQDNLWKYTKNRKIIDNFDFNININKLMVIKPLRDII
jgi:hypothetical protein